MCESNTSLSPSPHTLPLAHWGTPDALGVSDPRVKVVIETRQVPALLSRALSRRFLSLSTELRGSMVIGGAGRDKFGSLMLSARDLLRSHQQQCQ